MRTRPFLILLMASTASTLLAGCGVSNLVHHPHPDEFVVQRQAPLVVPPDFALTPPQPGAPRPSSRSSQQETLDTMFGGPAQRSSVETSTLNKASATSPADPSIRSTVADPKTMTVSKSDVTRDIVSAPQGDGREAQTHVPAN